MKLFSGGQKGNMVLLIIQVVIFILGKIAQRMNEDDIIGMTMDRFDIKKTTAQDIYQRLRRKRS